MQNLLSAIKKRDDKELLYDYLHLHHPSIIRTNINETYERDYIFPNYNPHIQTYPRRVILFHNDSRKLAARVKSFIKDKMINDYIIIDNRAYIEYLNTNESDLVEKIPKKNWLIARFRKNKL